jgi:hypothetical protein
MPLAPDHRLDLKNSGLSEETITMMQVYSMTPRELTEFLAHDSPAIESALAFPYFDGEGNRNDFLRIKIFPSIKDADGHTIKYLQGKNTSPHLYILPVVTKFLADPKIPLYLVEGEKKTAKAVELGLAAIGIGGVWNWVKGGTTEPIEDFGEINLWGRDVVIVPDSDTWSEEKKSVNIRRAIFYLARELGPRGAHVKALVLGK